MTETTQKNLKSLYRILATGRRYEHALGILYFDLSTIAPSNAMSEEGETMSYFENQYFKLITSKKAKELIVYLHEHKDELEERDRVLANQLYEEYSKTKNVSPATQLRWSRIYNRAYEDWLKAKNAGKFSKFEKSLSKVITASRENVSLRENALPDLYDNLLNDCEKGMLTEDLDRFFGELRDGLTELLGKIRSSGHVIRRDFLSRRVPVHKQREFSDYLLKLNGFDFDRGCITTTEHPFTSDISKDDARVTTHYHENMFISNMYSVIHEGGHAIFMQNEPDEDYDHYINDSITNGMHESVSRFYENVIGRSEEYISLIYPKIMELFGEELGDVSERELYEAVNIVEPSLIRTEADEVTYGLHIVIRYEMEKMICSGRISVKEIPETWNRLYGEYLGVTPKNDAEGVLQDVHWSSGFGYFPSYAIGNAYNAIYSQRMEKEIGLRRCIAAGDFGKIKSWMKDNVFAKANILEPKEWLRDITGKDLTASDFIAYLNEKYSGIYGF